MEPIEVTIDEDGKVTVIIDLKNGKRGELELPFNLAKDLLMKLRSRLESFENRRGWRLKRDATEGTMSSNARYWILHWIRVVLWPLPVLTLFRVGRGALNLMRH